jgi:8-oxo-dGTP diphosphatase
VFFGSAIPGDEYVLRCGGYAIVRNSCGEVALVKTPRRGYHLPGGGQEVGETAEQAAVREAFEETGLRIRILSPLGIADQRLPSIGSAAAYRKRCSYFLAEVTAEGGNCEDGHMLEWKRPQEAIALLDHASHAWAVAKAFSLSHGRPVQHLASTRSAIRRRRPS